MIRVTSSLFSIWWWFILEQDDQEFSLGLQQLVSWAGSGGFASIDEGDLSKVSNGREGSVVDSNDAPSKSCAALLSQLVACHFLQQCPQYGIGDCLLLPTTRKTNSTHGMRGDCYIRGWVARLQHNWRLRTTAEANCQLLAGTPSTQGGQPNGNQQSQEQPLDALASGKTGCVKFSHNSIHFWCKWLSSDASDGPCSSRNAYS